MKTFEKIAYTVADKALAAAILSNGMGRITKSQISAIEQTFKAAKDFESFAAITEQVESNLSQWNQQAIDGLICAQLVDPQDVLAVPAKIRRVISALIDLQAEAAAKIAALAADAGKQPAKGK